MSTTPDNCGFLTFATDEKYVRLAVKAAHSLWKAWGARLSIVVPEKLVTSSEYVRTEKMVSPNIFLIAVSDSAWSNTPFGNEWMAYKLSPYEHTIKIDADMFFSPDWIVPWEDLMRLSKGGMGIISPQALDYKGNITTSRFYRKAFDANGLPDVYSAFFYFDKSLTSETFFSLVKDYFDTWPQVRRALHAPSRPKAPSTDVIYAMVSMHMRMDPTVSGILKFVHMKTYMNFPEHEARKVGEKWNLILPMYVNNDHQIMVGNYRQIYPFHYYLKELADLYVLNV